VPRVDKKDGILKKTNSNPFTKPHPAPKTIPITTIQAPKLYSFAKKAQIKAMKPTISPTDKSMLPIRITNVPPMATRRRTEDCLMRLNKLINEKKRGLDAVKIAIKRAKNTNGTIVIIIFLFASHQSKNDCLRML
jgi:hypothetical protein